MTGALLEVTIIVLLVLFNGVLAGSEFAVVASRKAKLRERGRLGDERALRALRLAERPDRFLSTVQIGITSVAVVAGAFGGTRVAATLSPGLARLGASPSLADAGALVLVVVAITLVTLVVGELVPKRIALHDPERVAARLSGPMHQLSRIATPLVHLLTGATDLVLRLVPLRGAKEPEITEDELRGMIAHAVATGVLEATEQQITERLFQLSDATIESLATPREAVVWLDRGRGPDDWRERLSRHDHTRFLVADGDLDRLAGYVQVQDLLRQAVAAPRMSLDALLRQPLILPGDTPAFRLLERFQETGVHIAVIRDGDWVRGIVTLTDILDALVGDLPKRRRLDVPGIVRREDGSLLVDGRLPLEALLQWVGRPVEAAPDLPTVHAFVAHLLDREPDVAAVARWRDLRVEIVDMDGSRIDKVLVIDEATGNRADPGG
jgi:putative hemolysin